MRDARAGAARVGRAARRWLCAALGAGLAVGATGAWARDAVPSNAQIAQWASSCVTCHGAAKPVKDSAIPMLAGRPADEIERQMREFAAGQRAGLVMQQIARGYDPNVIHAIAQWYARLAPEHP